MSSSNSPFSEDLEESSDSSIPSSSFQDSKTKSENGPFAKVSGIASSIGSFAGNVVKKVGQAAIDTIHNLADKGQEIIDNQIRKKLEEMIQSVSNNKIPNLLRDVAMAVSPVLILWLVPTVLA